MYLCIYVWKNTHAYIERCADCCGVLVIESMVTQYTLFFCFPSSAPAKEFSVGRWDGVLCCIEALQHTHAHAHTQSIA